ncbi:MAG: hypothetical protein WC975_03215 [Phycisphaerae bacterium]
MKIFCLVLLVAVLVVGVGCQSNYNRMSLVNYANAEKPEELFQNFSQSFFAGSPGGEYEILLTTSEPISKDGGKVLRQVVFVTTLWNPIPGKTYAESSQINAKIIYLVEIADCPGGAVIQQSGKKVICYKGSGFVSSQTNRTGQVLTGRIEQALLEPVLKGTHYRLGRFALSGNFRATRNRAAVGEFKITGGARN